MKNKICLYTLLGVFISSSCYAQRNEAIDKYIFSLTYNPKELLRLPADNSTESLPVREVGSSKVIICKNEKKGIEKDLDEIIILNSTSAIVYPGALVHADKKLAAGRPTAISLPHSAMTISVDLPGLTNNGFKKIDNFNHSTYQSALNNILEEWNKNPSSQEYVNPSKSSLVIKKASSKSQLALSLGFSSEWLDNKISSNFNFSNKSQTTSTVALFRQVFYTVNTDLPQYPSEVFAENVTLDDLKTQGIDSNSPPAYVKSVDYGRLIFIKMDTHRAQSKGDLEATLKYVTSGDVSIDTNTKNHYQNIINNSTFTVMTLGGNAQQSTEIFDSSKISKLHDLIKDNSVYSRKNPGVPIAYTISFLKNNEIAAINSATNYMDTSCTEYPNGYIKLNHSGGYIAKFRLDWQQKDNNGNNINKSWESGNQTAGWNQTINLPGDAHSIRIQGWANTGLVWNLWQEIMNITENGPTNKCYKARGTTLNRKWDNSCK